MTAKDEWVEEITVTIHREDDGWSANTDSRETITIPLGTALQSHYEKIVRGYLRRHGLKEIRPHQTDLFA